jgi:hypothetical protein
LFRGARTPPGEHLNSLDYIEKVFDQRAGMHFVTLPKNGGAVFSTTPEDGCLNKPSSGS